MLSLNDNELKDDDDEPTDEGVSRVLHSVPSFPTLVLGPTSPVRVRMGMTVSTMIVAES